MYFEVLHPHHKLHYFKSAMWDKDWIATAKQIVRDEFERKYKDSVDSDAASNTGTGHDTVSANLKKVHSFSVFIINPPDKGKEHF